MRNHKVILYPHGVSVVIAARTDDTIVLKHAHRMNCPVVNRDGFKDHVDEWKLDHDTWRETRWSRPVNPVLASRRPIVKRVRRVGVMTVKKPV